MEFKDLEPGQLARVPRMHAMPGEQPAPAVRVEFKPTKCRSFTCPDRDLITRDIETGQERIYHRPPDFQVVLITPAIESKESA